MLTFTESTCKSALTPWGLEVKKRLLERESERQAPFTQDDIVLYLTRQGFKISKAIFSNLLRGMGATKRQGEIAAINKLLDIPSS
jgi:arginine repressor